MDTTKRPGELLKQSSVMDIPKRPLLIREKIIEFLKKNKNKWFTISQICKELNIQVSGSNTHHLKLLQKQGRIESMPCQCGKGILYKFKN